MSRPIIEVRNLSKVYQLGSIGATRLKDDVERLWMKLRGKPELRKKGEFWALRDVSFEMQRGEVLGIIGRNGAGKSTLLKILSRITQQTQGEIILRGRVASLLEVGTGFHPDLSGRENIYLNGAILGMTRAEIRRKFDEIVAFAEVDQFIDTPVKRYSSGMYVRLAFAVAAHLEPEILIVDEVLAVGDIQFQRKCLGKMNEVSHSSGRTILFVSHNMAALSSICNRCALFKEGHLVTLGESSSVISNYLSSDQTQVYEAPVSAEKQTYIQRAWIEDSNGNILDTGSKALQAGDEFILKVRLQLRAKHTVEFVASFYDPLRRPLWFFSHTLFKLTPLPARGEVEISLRYRLPRLNVNLLTIDLALTLPNSYPALDLVLNALVMPIASDDGSLQISGSEMFPMLVEPEYSTIS